MMCEWGKPTAAGAEVVQTGSSIAKGSAKVRHKGRLHTKLIRCFLCVCVHVLAVCLHVCMCVCYSYYDIMLKPILDAAIGAFKNQEGKTFHFGMQGVLCYTCVE